MMPEICHSFVSRYAAIASAARNERERPVLLASFSSRLLVERFTRTENAGFWSSDLREQKMCLCSYVYSISHAPKCGAQLCDGPATAGRSMRLFTASVQRENLKAGAALS